MKSISALRAAASTRIATWICAPLSSGSVNAPSFSCGDDAAHRLLGVVLHVPHVGLHDVEAELRDHRAQLLHALLVGGDLRLQVGEVLLRVARRVARRSRSSASISASRRRPPSTSLTLSISTPSSSMRVENGGIEPGVMPPMSAWWPREPT